MNRKQIVKAPRFISMVSDSASGCSFGIVKLIMVAGTMKFTSDGRNRLKNSKKLACPLCHTIRVVISPKGLKAPPALAATTILIQETAMNEGLPAPTDRTTAPINSAVVKLSAIGDRKKAIKPVIQNNARLPNFRLTSQERSASNTFRSVIALM